MTREQAQEQTGALTALRPPAESWFRPDPRITWLDPRGDGSARRALALVRAAIGENERHV